MIVAQLDRLSRLSLADAHKIIERIEASGGQVIAVAENFDPTTPEGEMGRNVMLSVARMQRRRYQGQFAAAKERAVREGIWPIPIVPLGYRRATDRRLELDPAAVRQVVRAFEARAAGESWRAVGRILDRGPSGARKIIRNRVYLGEINYGEWSNPRAHPPLVDRALFESAQLEQPRPPRGRSGPSLLAGLLRCAGCQGVLTPDQLQYRCQHKRAAGPCEAPALIAKSIVEPFVERTVLAAIEDIRVDVRRPSEDLDDVVGALEEAERELAVYQRATSAVDVGAEHFADGLRLRVQAVEQARRDLAKARLQSKPIGELAIGDSWPDLTVLERRHVLRGALGVVWVRKGRGPAEGRIKISTESPASLPRLGHGRYAIEPIDWSAIDAVLQPPLDDLAKSTLGAGA